MSSGRMNRRRGPRFDGGRDDSRVRFDRDPDPDRTEPGDPRRLYFRPFPEMNGDWLP